MTKKKVETKAAAKKGRPRVEIVEATAELLIFVNQDDVDGANRADFENCAFARACKRLFQSTYASFKKCVAYVDLPDEKGVRRLHRFWLDEKSQKAIADYDHGLPFPVNTALRLTPARKAAQLQTARSRRERIASEMAEAARKGVEYVPPKGVGRKPGRKVMKTRVVDTTMRNGTGMAHFHKYMQSKEKAA